MIQCPAICPADFAQIIIMAIDYSIDYDCVPRQQFTTQGILDRLKGRERARMMIEMYRQQGDERPPSEMGFEFTRRTPDGESKTELIVVQDLLDEAAELDALAHHCKLCPANRTGKPFGCTGYIQYPLSAEGEAWLLSRLPEPENALIWLLLRKGIEDLQYDGVRTRLLRQQGLFFEQPVAQVRRLGEFSITADQVFEMIFSVGDIIPNHAGILLLFFMVIPRNLQADEIMHITPAGSGVADKHPFLIDMKPNDEQTTAELKDFFYALYVAWALNVKLYLDA